MKINKTIYISIILIIFNLFSITTKAQVASNDLKAALILHFCNNVSWQNELPDTINIGCYNNDDLYNFLKPAEQKIKIQEKNIKIIPLNSISETEGLHAIYYNGTNSDELMVLFNHSKSTNTLFITDNVSEELFVLINFIDKSEKVEFKVNMPNLNLAGFSVKPNLLLNGGSVVDINAAYKNFEEKIQIGKNKLDRYKKDLEQSQNEINQKNSLISEKESQLNLYLKNINELKQQSDNLKNDLDSERKQLENYHNKLELQKSELSKSNIELAALTKNIKVKEEEFNQIKNNLEELENEAKNLKFEITEKDFTLLEKESLISSQQRILILILALAVALIMAGIMLYRLFILKKRHNFILAQKVEERTKELKLSNMQYQSLFNLAPVALWETDFSDVKKYIKSFGISSSEEVNKIAKEKKDFTIECVRRINFINLNKSALELFKIESKDEILEIYEKLHAEGKLTELIPEFHLIIQEKVTNTFESVRKNKKGDIIELIVTWVDISEQPGNFDRVILSLIDITHLRKVERELKKHQNELELLIREKTNDLQTANEELKSSNEELFEKNEIINNQNSELKTTLQHLQETQTQLLRSEKMASLGVLTAGVAHEINNPLNYILGGYTGLANFFKENDQFKDDTVSLLLDSIFTGVNRASEIVNGLSQFSRSNAASDEKCFINEIVENCLVMLENKIKHRIEIEKDLTNDLAIVLGNVGELHQVFLNILSNAEQAIGENGKVKIKTNVQKDKVNIEITDTGHGIAEENIKKITDPFFTTKDPGKGTGLGLSITYKIIREHSGTLKYRSKLNTGTTAIIQLPLMKYNND